MSLSDELIGVGRELGAELRVLKFSEPVTHRYLTTDYAAAGYEGYLRRYGNSKKRVLLLGMNPGPFGMAQTGVPFGEVSLVRGWMGLRPEIGKPDDEHPKRRISGMACEKSEVSGRRLWGFFSEKFPKAGDFFRDHLVMNFCPLIWMSGSGGNVTPDKIKAVERVAVDEVCQRHLCRVIDLLDPQYLIGVGGYAEKQLQVAATECNAAVRVGRILHPSPASPVANRGWAAAAGGQLAGILGESFWEE